MAETDLEVRMRTVENAMAVEQQRLSNHIENDKYMHEELEDRLSGQYNRKIRPLIARVDELSKVNTYGSGFKAGMVLSIGAVWALFTVVGVMVWNYLTGK